MITFPSHASMKVIVNVYVTLADAVSEKVEL